LDLVVVWINGGPTCSGLSAFLHSFGKYVLSCDGICSDFWSSLIIGKNVICSSLTQYVQLIFFTGPFSNGGLPSSYQ
jgi:carboxypeptidase C (cathepsin A)